MGLYNANGSINVTVPDGSSLVGAYAADGSMNVTVSDPDVLCGFFAPDGSRYVTVTDGTTRGFYAPNGSMYISEDAGVAATTGAQYVTVISGTLGGLTPAMAMMTAYSRSLTDEIASYEAAHTRTSHATMFDEYGLLTFAPNNLVTYSEDQTTNWSAIGGGAYSASASDDPNGDTGKVTRVTGTTTNDGASKSFTAGSVITVIGSFYVRSRTGADQSVKITISGTSGTTQTAPASGAWVRLGSTASLVGAGSRYVAILAATASAIDIDVTFCQSESVTHETTPRTYNATTSAAYYGPRFVYAPETLTTSSTSLAIGVSKASASYVVTASNSFSIGQVVQITDNADPANYIRGYVTAASGSAFTIGPYTFPGTAYTLNPITGGSGTISDWSCIRSDGYLAEPSAQNLFAYSQELDSVSISKQRMNVDANVATAPDGTATADRLVDDGSGGTNAAVLFKNFNVSASTAYTWSVFAKADQLSMVTLRTSNFTTPGNVLTSFDLSSGTVVSTGSGHTPRIKPLLDGWYRCSITFTTDVTDTNGDVQILPCQTAGSTDVDLDGTSSVLVWGAQFELGSVATSYYPTTTAPLTRNADVATMTGTDFSDWWNATEGTFVAKFNPARWADTCGVISGQTSNYVYLYQGSTGLTTYSSGASLSTANSVTVSSDNFGVVAYNASGKAICLNGGTVASDALPFGSGATSLGIGHRITTSNSQLVGPVSEVIYFPTRESDAQLVTLTGG